MVSATCPKTMPKVQKSSLRFPRSSSRYKGSYHIKSLGLIARFPCGRCSAKTLSCYCLEDGRCFECVGSGMEKSCDAEGMSRLTKELLERRAAFEKALEESAIAQ